MGQELARRYTAGTTMLTHPSPLPITLYHCAWRNAADALVYTIVALPLLLSTIFKPLFWTLPCFVLVACHAGRLWWRAFDRSPQIQVDESGIWTKRYGRIDWGDMESARILPGRNPILAIRLREKQPWLARAGWLTRTMHARNPSRPLTIGQRLLHMGADYRVLSRVLKERYPAFTPCAAGA